MRDVAFEDIDVFLAEMHLVRGSIAEKIVRCEVTQEEVNSGKSRVIVIASFCVGEQMTQLQFDCGVALLGSDNSEASADTSAAVMRIDKACVENGLEFRRGVYQ